MRQQSVSFVITSYSIHYTKLYDERQGQGGQRENTADELAEKQLRHGWTPVCNKITLRMLYLLNIGVNTFLKWF